MMLGFLCAAVLAQKAPFCVSVPTEVYCPDVIMTSSGVVSGSKALTWQDAGDSGDHLVFSIDEQVKFGVFARVGWPPFKAFSNVCDVASGTMSRMSDLWKNKERTGDRFEERLVVSNDAVYVTCRFKVADGATQQEPSFGLMLPMDAVAGKSFRAVSLRGRRTDDKTFVSAAEWGPKEDPKFWIHAGYFGEPKSFVFNPDDPANGWALEVEPNEVRALHIYRAPGKAYLTFSFPKERLGEPFTFKIKFGPSVVKKDVAHCVVNGTDFTACNDQVFAYYDAKRNLLMNPGFESGARYWHNYRNTTFIPDYLVTNDTHSGKMAIRPDGNHVCSMALPVEFGKPYTISFWAKAAGPKSARCFVAISRAAWKAGPRYQFQLQPGAWQRFSATYVSQDRGISFSFGGKDVIFDDFQFEPGTNATADAANPIGFELVTDAPDHVAADVGVPFNARLLVRGAPGSTGKIAVSVTDFFSQVVHSGELSFDLGLTGEQVLPLCPESALVRNSAYTIRLDVSSSDGAFLPFVDFLRLNRYPFATGHEKYARYNQKKSIHWNNKYSVDLTDRSYRLYSTGGSAIRCHSDGYGREDGLKIVGLARKHGGDDWCDVLNPRFRKQLEDRGFGELKKLTSFSNEVYAACEEIAYDYCREHNWITNWYGGGEVIGNYAILSRKRDMTSWAKLQRALYAGVKRANPKNFMMSYSVCNSGEQGRREIVDFLRAGLAIDPEFRFEGVDVHPYRCHPEDPDLDSDLTDLVSEVAKLGYKGLKIMCLEGGYFYPLSIAPWGDIAPWAGTFDKDKYCPVHLPSYDLGWGEKMSAAMLARYNLMMLKHADSGVIGSTSWNLAAFDAETVIATYLATAAQAMLLAEATFIEDLRFAASSRAYLYDDGKGRVIAAFWKGTTALDRGLEAGDELILALRDVEVFDIMGNRVEVESVGGRLRLPLGPTPVYLRVPKARMDDLRAAFLDCETTGRQELPLAFTFRPLDLGHIEVKIENPLSRRFRGKVRVGEGAEQPLALEPRGSFGIKAEVRLTEGELNRLTLPVVVSIGETQVKKEQSFTILPVPYGRYTQSVKIDGKLTPCGASKVLGQSWGGKSDLSAAYRVKWTEEGLDFAFDVKDDVFAFRDNERWGISQWYNNDSIQLYLDTFGDAPLNAIYGKRGFDVNDMSYELLPTNETTCIVYRREAPDHQLTGGVGVGLQPNEVVRDAPCEFKYDAASRLRTYRLTLSPRNVLPMVLEPGATPGFGVIVFDRDETTISAAKQCLASVPSGSPKENPHEFTTLLLLAK